MKVRTMRRMFFVLAFSLCLTGIMTGCGSKKQVGKIITEIKQLHSGDAKFYKDDIITSVGGHLAIYDKDGKLKKKFSDIDSNWIDCFEDEKIIVYGNGKKQIGILQLDNHENAKKNEIVMETENLQIDPTILKVNGKYYMTATEIIGTVNNADKNAENGRYILHLYQSEDLSHWSHVSDVVDEKHNIEDVDVAYLNDKFYITYEQETVDKGDSSIHIAVSDDPDGKKFSNHQELIKANCDHEPATFVQLDSSKYRLYYSCDKNNRGESYQKSQAFYADFDKDWNIISQDNLVNTETKNGILLYDVRAFDGKLQYLYARNYLTDCDLVVEEMKE